MDRYVGIPWKHKGRDHSGCDCWGLTRLVYKECLNIDLPSFADDYLSVSDTVAMVNLIEHHKFMFQPLDKDRVLPYDVVLMIEGGEPIHLGVVQRSGYMLHMPLRRCAVIESYTSGTIHPKVVGFFRHESRACY